MFLLVDTLVHLAKVPGFLQSLDHYECNSQKTFEMNMMTLMKNAAKCELQNSVNHRVFERILHSVLKKPKLMRREEK